MRTLGGSASKDGSPPQQQLRLTCRVGHSPSWGPGPDKSGDNMYQWSVRQQKSPVEARVTNLPCILELIGIQEHGSIKAGLSECRAIILLNGSDDGCFRNSY